MTRPTEEQIARWYPRLYRTALRLTGSTTDAADLTQQAFYKALRAWDRFDGSGRRTTWLHSILLNCVRDWARRRKVRAADPLDEWRLPTTAERVEARLCRNEELAALRGAIKALPIRLQQAFILSVLDGYAYQETAEVLDVPIGTVASRVHAARQKVRATVQRELGDT